MGEATILTLNTKSVRSDSKWSQLSSFLDRHFPDVILLQETNTPSAPLPLLITKYTFFFNPPVQVCTGTMIGLRKSSPMVFRAHNILCPGYLQELLLGIPATNRTLHVISVYLPHDQHVALDVLGLLERHIRDVRGAAGADVQVLVGGDFNCTLNPNIDRSGGNERYPRLVNLLRDTVTAADMSDLWREFHPVDPGFTFVGNAPFYSASRIDRFYATPGVTSSVTGVRVLPSFSDHLALLTTLSLRTPKFASPYWRFDNTLLDDPGYGDCVRELLTSFEARRNMYTSLHHWWDALKQEIRTTTIRFVRLRRQLNDETFVRLERRVDRIVSSPLLEGNLTADLARANEQVREAYTQRGARVLAHSRYEQLLAIDSPAAPNLARDMAPTFQPLKQLRFEGRVVSDGPSLCTAARRHFSEVYGAMPVAIDGDSPLYESLPTLSRFQRESLDRPFTHQELSEALGSLNKGKAPGIDGLTPEFYSFFWSELSDPFRDVLECALEVGSLPKSAQKSILSLLPKSGDRMEIKNWRPISLLTVDYKIVARAMATRLSEVVGSLVHPDQGYCIPGRTIFDSVHLHRDVLAYASEEGVPLAVLSLDQQGAFDRVNHDYLFHLLRTYKFGESFVSTLRTLYAGATCHVRVGCCLTAPFAFGRGIRQGCPLSGLLFSLTAEPFLRLCRSRLEGFPLPGLPERRLVVSGYADDFSAFIANDQDFDRLRDVYDVYSAQSGAKLNAEKSTGLWAGSWIGRQDTPLGFAWSSEGAKVLGVVLGNTPGVVAGSLDDLHAKFLAAVQRWRFRASAMSLRGRVLVANQFLAPRLWYTFQIIPPPPAFINRLQGELANFVWAGRRHWTRLRELCAPPHLGGLGLVHLASKVAMFRVLYAHRYLVNLDDHPCHAMTRHFLGKFRRLGLGWQVLFHPQIGGPAARSTSEFLRTVLVAWFSLQPQPQNFPSTIWGIRDVPLTLTSLIPTATSPFIPSWSSLGCRTLGDLLVGDEWRGVDQLEGFNGLPGRTRAALRINGNRIRAFCDLRFRGVLQIPGPEPWPPALLYRRPLTGKLVPLLPESNRRSILLDLMVKGLGIEGSAEGEWSADRVNWKGLARPPSLGLDSEVVWRFNKNRLADPIFLYHAGLTASRLCPWCRVEGSAWHMLVSCRQATRMWRLADSLIRGILGRLRLCLKDLYVGFWPDKSNNVTQIDLANYVLVLAKSTVYRLLVCYFKDGRAPAPYEIVLKARLKSRLLKEYAWHLARGTIDGFRAKWCEGEVLCSVLDGELLFSEALSQ